MAMVFMGGKFEGCFPSDLRTEDLFWLVYRSRPLPVDLAIGMAELRRRKAARRL
jgi:hypothetical protein